MPSGRLCPRMDRYKCPLHGKIIPRNNMGTPVNEDDKKAEEASQNDKSDDWQDPELLKDIEAATGINLQVQSKKKGKRKYTEGGLTDIHAKQNTVRKRLEKIVFNRSALKRVAEDVHKSEVKKYKTQTK